MGMFLPTMMDLLLIFWQQYAPLCPSRVLLGIECPGCGLQRSIWALCEGRFQESFFLHPATIPFLFLMGYSAYHIAIPQKKGARRIVILESLVAVLSITFYIYKITTGTIHY